MRFSPAASTPAGTVNSCAAYVAGISRVPIGFSLKNTESRCPGPSARSTSRNRRSDGAPAPARTPSPSESRGTVSAADSPATYATRLPRSRSPRIQELFHPPSTNLRKRGAGGGHHEPAIAVHDGVHAVDQEIECGARPLALDRGRGGRIRAVLDREGRARIRSVLDRRRHERVAGQHGEDDERRRCRRNTPGPATGRPHAFARRHSGVAHAYRAGQARSRVAAGSVAADRLSRASVAAAVAMIFWKGRSRFDDPDGRATSVGDAR